jgi:hypothetical protein
MTLVLKIHGKHGEVFLMRKNKVYGLRATQARVIDDFMKSKQTPMGANSLKHHLIGIWSIHSAPTPREIGSYLRVNPNYQRVNKHGQGAGEYLWIGD